MLLWDGLRQHDGSCEITLRDLAKLMQCDLRTLERRMAPYYRRERMRRRRIQRRWRSRRTS
jgi:hypothetical protein